MEIEEEMSEDDIFIEKMFKGAADRRRMTGYILENFIVLEFHLSEVLEEYFMGDRYKQRTQFKNLILDNLHFDRKIQILKILKFEKVERMNFNEDIYQDLRYIQEVRNKLIHNLKKFDKKRELYYIDCNVNGVPETIYLDDEFIEKIEELFKKIDGRLIKIKMVLEREWRDSKK